MEFIEVRNTEELVRIEITIEYIGPSKYKYVVSAQISFPDDSPTPNTYPHPHDIGLGEDLLLIENIRNDWSFQLLNPANQELDYKVFIKWYQGDVTEPIYEWERSGKINDQPVLLNGNCNYEPK